MTTLHTKYFTIELGYVIDRGFNKMYRKIENVTASRYSPRKAGAKLILQDMLDIWAELPEQVKTSLVSFRWIMTKKSRSYSLDYHKTIAVYLLATQFYDFSISEALFEDDTFIRLTVRKNAQSELFEQHKNLFD